MDNYDINEAIAYIRPGSRHVLPPGEPVWIYAAEPNQSCGQCHVDSRRRRLNTDLYSSAESRTPFRVAYFRPLRANMTSSIKPEVHNVSQRPQIWLSVGHAQKLGVKIGPWQLQIVTCGSERKIRPTWMAWTAVMSYTTDELLQPQDLACGTLFQSSCVIPTSRAVPTTDEGTPFSGSVNTALCDFWYAAP